MTTYKNVEGLFALIEGMAAELESVSGDYDYSARPLVPAYGKLYELPVAHLAAFIFQAVGLRDRVAEVTKSEDPTAAMLAFAQEDFPDVNFESALTWPVLAAAIVLMRNLEAVALFHTWMKDLVARVGQGDDEALFQAVYVDPSVMQTDCVGSRISMASVGDDRDFFVLLGKALTRSRPIRPRDHLDETRILMEVLDEAGKLKSMTNAELTEWATNLGLYPVDRDALQAISRQRRQRKKVKSHRKGSSGDSQ